MRTENRPRFSHLPWIGLILAGTTFSAHVVFESGTRRGQELQVIDPLIGAGEARNDWVLARNEDDLLKGCEGESMPKVWRTGGSSDLYEHETAGRILSPEIELSATRCSSYTLVICHYFESMKGIEGGNVVLWREGDELNGPLTVLFPSAGKPYTGLIGTVQSKVPNIVRSERGFTGASDEWVLSYFDISKYAGKTVRLGFDFGAPVNRTSPGWLIGWMKVLCDTVVHPSDVQRKREPKELSLNEAMKVFKLQPSEPEPFSETAGTGYVTPIKAHVNVDVVDPLGRTVQTLADSTVQAGFYKVYWDGTDDRGQEVQPGVYFFRYRVASFEALRRCTLVRD
jgi:hypothetical protein